MVPFFGWFLWRVGMIGVDRDGGAKALKKLVSNCQKKLTEGRSIIIFPQGTRTPTGINKPYLPGTAALYKQCKVPVVPTALNSGIYWPRRRFIKNPGCIIIEFLPCIEPGLTRVEFSDRLKKNIETATKNIEAESCCSLNSNP